MVHCVVTDSIACSTTCRYLSYSEADFGVFCPAGATRCTDGVKFGMQEGTDPFCMPNFTPCNDKGIGPPKLKFLLRLIKMWNINARQGHIPCTIFTKFAEFVPHYRMRYLLQFRWICSRGYGVTGSHYPQIFSAPSGQTMHQTSNVFEVQERAGGPLSPCQVWWGSDFTRRRGGQKRGVFLSVCLSVCSSRF